MKKLLTSMIACLIALGAQADALVLSSPNVRKLCIDEDWHFHYGDGSAAVSDASVVGSWRTLTLPHDWSMETEAAEGAGGRVIGPFSSNSIGGYQTGFTVGGEGWYQKTLTFTSAEIEGRVSLYFEGAYNQSYVYVNGTLCHTNVYGYSSFRVDVTDQLHTGENNVVVKVVNNGNNTRWYAGSGIYRHVWLIRTNRLHLDEWDTYVNATDNANVAVSTILHNESNAAKNGSIQVIIKDNNGTEVSQKTMEFNAIAANGEELSTLNIQLSTPHTWSPEMPYLYSAVIRVKDSEGTVVDELTQRFGFRTLSFSATDGFLLNGVSTLLRGGCVHHDNGLLGAAAFDKAERRKLQLLKAQGFNAVRCSHNLPSENFLNVCDEIGLMVIDECFDQWLIAKNAEDYHQYFAAHSDDDIAVMLRRDRNHPSIIMWSIGNEIPGRVEEVGKAAAARLRADVRQYDTTRPVTAAICGWDAGDAWNSAGGNWEIQCANAFMSLDVGGYNYLYDKYERDHSAAPDRVICGLESFPKQASENWALVERLPYVIGDFVWTAMDYLGEAGIGAAYVDHDPSMFQGWPWFNGYCGDIDLIGQKKPQSYYRDIVWRQSPVTMAVQPTSSHNNAWGWQLEEQSWTWPEYEGQNVSVNVYSRASKVRLYLNGESMGDHSPGSTFWTGYSIPYQAGTLRVVNLDASGNEIEGEEFVLKTTGKAVAARLVYEDATLSADANDLAYVTIELVDADGNVVTSDKETQLTITNTGAGELIACGTGSPNDMRSFRATSLTVFRGRALAILRSNGTAGAVSLNVEMQEHKRSTTAFLFDNADFDDESLDGWVVSDNKYIKYKDGVWKSTELDGYLECFVGWGNATTLAGQSISQSTKVLPAGTYTVSFDYNGTFYKGSSHYLTGGEMTDVTVSIGGESVSLTAISGSQAQHTSLSFTLTEPQAVTLLFAFGNETNADWFALDNVTVEYEGSFDFEHFYQDRSVVVPAFGGSNWPRVSGNASGSYTETKLSSSTYNGAGLAYWSASAPTDTHFFKQAISNLPAGKYGVAAYAAANRWSSSDNDRDNRTGTCFFASTSGRTTVQTPVTSATYGLYSLVIDVNKGETLTLGLLADETNGNNWCYLAGVTLVKLDLTLDENAVQPPTTGITGDVVLDRRFYEGWNTLCLPFDVDESTLQNLFGEDVQVVTLRSASAEIIRFETSTSVIANVPCLIKLSADKTDEVFRFHNISIDVKDESMTNGEAFNFVGSYIRTAVESGDYILGSGNSFKKAAGGNDLKAFRAFMRPLSNNVKASAIVFDIDDTPTSISQINGKPAADTFGQLSKSTRTGLVEGTIYNLAGQRIKVPLRHHIYVAGQIKRVM